jgi:DNA (cytosine-5)-methyltransferase 1
VLERCGVLPVVVTGGFPCQPHSCAGKRLASADDRDLWGECRRILGDLRPRYALFENVAGLLTSESGRFFNRVLSDLAALRYACVWQVVPASAVGAPHRRERVWIICRDESLAHPDKCGGQQDWKPAELRATRTQQPSVNRGRSDAGKDAEEQVWPALAGHWPSRPGEAQHGWEPPRVVGDPKQGGGRGVRPTGQQRQAGLTTRLESRRFAEWQTQPPLGTDADGLPAAVGGAWPEVHNRVAQLKGAGNAIVPQVAALLLKAILDAEHSTPKEP